MRSDADFIFYNKLKTSDGSIVHQSDNRTGQGEGDDEAVKIKLSSVPAEISRIVFAVTIYEGEANGQNFDQVENAGIRVANDAGGAEIARSDLSGDSAVETAMVFGEFYRNGDDRKFKAVG